MSNHAYISKVRLLTNKSIVINLSSSEKISRALLLISVAPALLCIGCAAISIHFRLVFLTIILGLLAAASLAFFYAITEVHLQAKHTIKIAKQGLSHTRYTMFGPRSTYIPSEDISHLTAKIDGGDEVLLCLVLKGNVKETLFPTPIDDLDSHIKQITSILPKKYIATVECMSVIAPPPLTEIDKPDCIYIDVAEQKIKFDIPNKPPVEHPFSAVYSIEAMGQREGARVVYTDSARSIEYACEPLMALKDGTLYFLQRFTSVETSLTPSSKAFISASKTADYLRKCIL